MTSVVLAGGGTAGHTSPLIATAHAVQELEPDAQIVCIGTARGLETRVVPAAGLRLELVTPVPMPRRPGADLAKLPFRLRRSTAEARRILTDAKADVLVGFGGYVSIPAYLAARRLGIPVVVHEANLVPGLANKVGARFARVVATTFSETPMRGAQLVGMPMRASITRPDMDQATARESFGLRPDLPTLLVSGGSQGAQRINTALTGAIDELLAEGVQVLHVLGPKNFDPHLHQRIPHSSGAAYLPLAFVDDMATAYLAADLMVGRAGAATVMETAVMGLPVIFCPLPWGNGEQGRNCAELVDSGAGLLLPDAEMSTKRLTSEVLALLRDEGRLERMSQTARGLYPSDAAEVLARAVLDQKGTP